METSELINKLVDSLTHYGDLPTNINFMGWYCPSEGGSFKAVHLIATDDREVEILDEEDKKIEIPQEFLADVNSESEIVLIKDDIGHDYGYKNSIGFITSRSSMGECFIFAFDKRANRWWSCRFDKDEYIRTGLFVSDIIYKPFKVEPIEDEFIDIESYIGNVGRVDESNIEEYIHILFNQQSTLIQNQKKIIEKLKEEGK